VSPLIHPYANLVRKGFEDEAAADGASTQWLTASDYNVQQAVGYAEQALGYPCLKGMGIITTEPPAFEAVIQKALSMKIPVAAFAACASGIPGPVCLSVDDVSTYQTVAQQVAQLLNHTGAVVIAGGFPSDGTGTLRSKTLVDYFQQNEPNITVYTDVSGCDSPDKTVGCAENALSAHPDMKAYLTTGQQNTVGAETVFPKAGRSNIIVTASDDSPDTLDAISKGTITFSIAQFPEVEGHLWFYALYQMAQNGLTPTTPNWWLKTPIILIDKTNVATYAEQTGNFIPKYEAMIDQNLAPAPSATIAGGD
jgi:ABC-type sugar transport system substrate-binding protein